jgi:hypothetical protein
MRTTTEADVCRYRLGQWTQHADAWLPREAWLACTDARPMPDDADVVLGSNGSYSGATLPRSSAVQIGEMPHIDVVRVWEPAERTPDQQVPIVDVEDALREACKRWRVQTIVADPFRWARNLQLLADDGLPVEEFPQSPQRMTPAHATVRRSRAQPDPDPLGAPGPVPPRRQGHREERLPWEPDREGTQVFDPPHRPCGGRGNGVRRRVNIGAGAAIVGVRRGEASLWLSPKPPPGHAAPGWSSPDSEARHPLNPLKRGTGLSSVGGSRGG